MNYDILSFVSAPGATNDQTIWNTNYLGEYMFHPRTYQAVLQEEGRYY